MSNKTSSSEPLGYDFKKEENLVKWKGVFVNSLRKVLEQVHPSLEVQEDALDYVESLILRLLGMLCEHPPPHTPQDVEERVRRTFPTPIDRWALKDAKDALEKGKKKSMLVLPVEKIHQLLQKEVLQHKIDWQVTLFIVGVLEYISADIFKLAGNYVKYIRHVEISYEDIKLAKDADMVLMDMFHQDDCSEDSPTDVRTVVSQTYEESVRDLIQDERQYLRDLQMIIKVFREEIMKITQDGSELELLFSNITDIYETTLNLLGSLEDIVESTEEKQTPTVGSCFEELAEAEEFDAYAKYAKDISSPESREVLTKLLSRPQANAALRAAGHGFKEAVKYYLPKLLMQPVYHCFLYFDYIKVLQKRTPNKDDKETLEQVEGLLRPLQNPLQKFLQDMESSKSKRDSNLRMQSRARRKAALEKTNELKKTVDGWDQKDVGQCCNEFIREDMLGKVGSNGRRITERKALLFDGLLVLCKPCSSKRVSVSVAAVAVGGNHSAHYQNDLRLKERFFIRKVDIIDREDTEELKNTFEIAPRDHPNVILVAKSAEDKNSWMADLVMLNTKSMLERTLDSILLDEEKKHPLKLPPPHMYKFADQDSPQNIVFEARENSGVPLIRGATLEKLIERLTYHIYADPVYVRMFLITYRSFCSPLELLTLLIERYEIPDPAIVYEEDLNSGKSIPKEDLKRYRKEFCQPVQFRVLNVLRHWVDHHFYDFDQDLLERLSNFLRTVRENCKSMRKWVDSVEKIIKRKTEPEQRQITFSFKQSPPPIESHINLSEEGNYILKVHPIELARQLTIYESELYRNVKPSELVGSVWTKKDKERKSPNLLRMIKHTTNFTRWIERNIVDAENFEERVAIVSRVIEIMAVLQELNNFNGVIAIVSAIYSAAIYRLRITLSAINSRFDKILTDCHELYIDHYKRYQEKLRSIDPPCVPFFGMYLTNILHIEEGNPDFWPDTFLINFNKRRKVAEVIAEIQQYQNQPYCLQVQPEIRQFIENICPFDPDMPEAEIGNYLYDKGLAIEPRGETLPRRVPRQWPNLNLKSPGIKPGSRTRNIPAPLQAVASTMRLNDLPSSQKMQASSELPETPPQGSSSSASDHSVFVPVLIGGSNARSPGSPGFSLPGVSLGSPGNSPQLGSPHFGFNSSSLSGSPSSVSLMQQPPPSPSILQPSGEPLPPPLPPRSHHRRRESSLAESPQQARQAPDAPLLPPRDGNSPPPLPPRRELSSSVPPRLPATLNPSSSALLSRRNSSLDNSNPINIGHARRHMSFNGPSPTKLPPSQPPNGSITPRLPPKPQVPGRPPATMFNFNAPPGSS